MALSAQTFLPQIILKNYCKTLNNLIAVLQPSTQSFRRNVCKHQTSNFVNDDDCWNMALWQRIFACKKKVFIENDWECIKRQIVV